ncbi:MAG: putative bifunctional diguanylate cyclase/phosphodiesterase [Acidiferrobacter sp.]
MVAQKRRDLRINLLAASLIVAASLVVGLAVFSIMRASTDTVLRRSLVSNLAVRAQWAVRDIRDADERARTLATRPFLARQVAAADSGRPMAAKAVSEGLRSFLDMKLSALALITRQGAVLAQAGHFVTAPMLAVTLHGVRQAQLQWDPRQGFVLHVRMPIRQAGHKVGLLVGETRLRTLTRLFPAALSLGRSANLVMCAPHATRMACFPPSLNPRQIFPNVARTHAGHPLPMSFALAGRSGFVTTRDRLGHHVAAAYTPVDHLGLGMVLTMNTAVLYGPVWRQLGAVAFLMVVVLVAAILALRWQLAPLVAELVTSEQRALEAISHWRSSESHVQAVLQNANEGIATISEGGIIESYNRAMERLFGYTEQEAVGQNVALLMPEPHHSQHDAYLQHYRETGEAHVIGIGREVMARHRDGSEFPIDLRVSEFVLEGVRRFIGTVRDATGRKENENRMRHVATHDGLTDLPNRTLIQVRMEQLIRRSERSGQFFAVMFVDLDRFKAVNDSLGHDVGDQLLCLVARRLTDLLRAEDTVGRHGGDEFVVLAASLVAPMDAALIADKLLRALSAPYVIGEHTLYIGASIGVALYPQDGRDVDTLLKHSDMAMYQAKAAGRGSYRCFDDIMNTLASDQLLLVSELHRALDLGELVLYYRPIVSFSDDRVVALEAQLWWRHPVRGLIAASEFLPIAEEAGLAVPLAEWAMRQACVEFGRWIEQDTPMPRLVVSLSSYQFRDQRLAQGIRAILAEADMDPQYLGLEITEDGIMDDPEGAIVILNEWRAFGVGVSVVEFGAGYSSLSYLKKLPLVGLKMDSSFTRDSTTDRDEDIMIATIIAMAHQLHLQVLAEGVDTEAQWEFLRIRGCDAYQGIRGGEPLRAEDCGSYLAHAHRAEPLSESRE